MVKISVIIPVYNTERYVEQCLWSVMDQTYGSLEIIVVDDGSVDNSAAVCARLAEKDGRIQVLRQKNSGVSAARNLGLNAATGEYVFFLDSDDAIHPLLLEEMLWQAEENHAQLAFCGYRKVDTHRLGAVLEAAAGSAGKAQRRTAAGTVEEAALTGKGQKTHCLKALERGGRARCLAADETGTEEWFHVKYTDTFSGIGGKLLLREAVGELRFDRGLTNGEDTFFLYQLVRKRVRSVYCQEEWYYYRMHGESVTSSAGTAGSMRYFESAVRIRDGEYGRGNADHAMRWEILVADQIRRSYGAQKRGKTGNSERTGKARQELRKIAKAEKRHPLFRRICFSDRVLFACCFGCYPVYVILNRIALELAKRRSR